MTQKPTRAESLAARLAPHCVEVEDYRAELVRRAVAARSEKLGIAEAEYPARLATDLDEPDALRAAITAPVTSFFRDRPVFDSLARDVLPALAVGPGKCGMRAWVLGVATGEEAWSLAMVLERARAEAVVPDWHVLATDRRADTLHIARAGRYPTSALANIPEFARSFVRSDVETTTVRDSLRSRVAFVVHDLAGPTLAPPEAVLAAFHLVHLRNVLIYFERALQRTILRRVAAVLEPGGALVLGSCETLPDALLTAFEPWPSVPASSRIYRRRGAH